MTLCGLKLFIYIRITQAGQGIFILFPKFRSENFESCTLYPNTIELRLDGWQY